MTTSLSNVSDTEIEALIKQLQVAYKLKQTLRYSTTRDFSVHSESVAEHVFALFFLAEFFLPLEDPEGLWDVQKIHRMILYHDFGEIAHGDVPYHQKTEEHKKQESEAAERIFSSLPILIQESAHASWSEYESQKSAEAHFVYALDKIEPLFELLNPINEHSMKRLKFSYAMHIGIKMQATEKFPTMRRFVEVATKDMLKRKVFWEEQ